MNSLPTSLGNLPAIMGIVNINSDSFYSESRAKDWDTFRILVDEMFQNQVDILDLGAMSSRPGSVKISTQEEIDRILPAIEWIKNQYPTIQISIDTFRAEVSKIALQNGVQIINDISGAMWEPELLKLVSEHKATIVLMHLLGNFETMHNIYAEGNIIEIVKEDLSHKIQLANQHSIKDIWIDPGFGFSKTLQQNWELLHNLSALKSLEKPILVGLSRKRMIYQTTGGTANDSLVGTSIANYIACQQGASILRVHDVKEAQQTRKIFETYSHLTGKQ